MSTGTVALIVAVVGFAGAVAASTTSKVLDRRQQTRALLIDRADRFARATHTALAELRHITPPGVGEAGYSHRNLILVENVDERGVRIERTKAAVDQVRAERSGLPLVFGTRSWTAEYGRQILGYLREAQETAEAYYAALSAELAWDDPAGQVRREQYKTLRKQAYDTLNQFYDSAAWCADHPHRRGVTVPEPKHDETQPSIPASGG